jgi:hypothetical protein
MEGIPMAIKFKLFPRKNPLDVTAAPKLFAKAVIVGKRNLKQLAERIAANTTMGVGDVYGVLLTLEQEIGYALEDSIAVELGEICIFKPSVNSEGVAEDGDFNVTSHLKKKGVNIAAKRSFVKKMRDVPVERV